MLLIIILYHPVSLSLSLCDLSASQEDQTTENTYSLSAILTFSLSLSLSPNDHVYKIFWFLNWLLHTSNISRLSVSENATFGMQPN